MVHAHHPQITESQAQHQYIFRKIVANNKQQKEVITNLFKAFMHKLHIAFYALS